MNHSEHFQIGFIKKPHGLKGDVQCTLDGQYDISEIPALFVELEGRLVPYFIESCSGTGERINIKFEDINSVEEAREISASKIFLQKSARPDLPKGSFYDDEIIGFSVSDENFGLLGVLEEIMAAGANRLLVVKKESNEVLIPENGPFILDVDRNKRTILVRLPEGFLEMNS